MTKEELKQKAEEYALEKCKECYMCNSEENGDRIYCAKLESIKEGYIAGAEPREKRIAELEALIEKMKCCYNCSKWNDGQCADIPDSGYCCADFVCEDWEIKEKK